MTSRILHLPLFLGFLLSPLAHADTFILKDGTELEGEIISETEDAYEIRYQVGKGIMDNKTVPKADIESIEKATPADKAFESIAGLAPTADRLTVEDYDRMIDKQVKPFLQAFGSSKHAKKAKEILEGLEKERAIVAEGGIKFDGAWISPSDREANAFEIDSRMLLADATAAAEAGSFVTALRALEQMHSDFQAAENYPEAVDLSLRIFKVYGARVEADMNRVDQLLETREKELATLPLAQRKAALSEIARKDAAYKALLERDRKQRIKWPVLELYHKDPMADTLRAIDAESRRLKGLDLSALEPAAPVYRDAWAAASAGKEEETGNLITELRSLRVPERYTTALEQKLAAALEPEETPEPDPAEPGGEDPDGDGSGDKPEPGDGDEPGNEPAAPGTDPTASGNEPPVADDESGIGGIGLSTILFGVIALVLVIAVVTVFAGGGKKK